jgi:hypothetical protein
MLGMIECDEPITLLAEGSRGDTFLLGRRLHMVFHIHMNFNEHSSAMLRRVHSFLNSALLNCCASGIRTHDSGNCPGTVRTREMWSSLILLMCFMVVD